MSIEITADVIVIIYYTVNAIARSNLDGLLDRITVASIACKRWLKRMDIHLKTVSLDLCDLDEIIFAGRKSPKGQSA